MAAGDLSTRGEQITIGHLLDYVPDIKPRLYSIASSSRLRGDNECHLCIIKNEWNATSGRSLTGLSTRWLSEDLHPEKVGSIGVRACVHPSAVTLPEKHTTPMVMVALGTGIAPMRAFIEERAAAKKDGEDDWTLSYPGHKDGNRDSYIGIDDACESLALPAGAYDGGISCVMALRSAVQPARRDEYRRIADRLLSVLIPDMHEKIYVTHRLQQNKKFLGLCGMVWCLQLAGATAPPSRNRAHWGIAHDSYAA
eukprot:Skav231247  [mRNA]  locus=scaffold411:179817:191806:+ [translate_table: standard]